MINIEDLSLLTRFDPDSQPHITLDKEVCRTCEERPCVQACPARCYTYTAGTGRLDIVYENCLECGTCLVICDKKAVRWKYPRGDMEYIIA